MRPFLISAALLSSLMLADSGIASEVITFDDEMPTQWKPTIGSWNVENGVLVGTEVEADKHAAASRLFIPITDGTVSCRVRLGSARTVSIGFDPKRGELKKKGHLYSLILAANKATVIKHRDKAVTNSKSVTIATEKISLMADQWVDVSITLGGDSVVAKVGETVLRGSDPEFKVAKPGVVFRVSKGVAYFDDVRVQATNE